MLWDWVMGNGFKSMLFWLAGLLSIALAVFVSYQNGPDSKTSGTFPTFPDPQILSEAAETDRDAAALFAQRYFRLPCFGNALKFVDYAYASTLEPYLDDVPPSEVRNETKRMCQLRSHTWMPSLSTQTLARDRPLP